MPSSGPGKGSSPDSTTAGRSRPRASSPLRGATPRTSTASVEREDRGSKTFVGAEPDGRTDVEGLYAAGRLADRYHGTVVAAGDGARTAITLVHDSDRPFYHDWVTPEGYFTDRGRDLPPGCEEIDDAERRRRERESMATMRSYFADPHPSDQPTHPSLRNGE